MSENVYKIKKKIVYTQRGLKLHSIYKLFLTLKFLKVKKSLPLRPN